MKNCKEWTKNEFNKNHVKKEVKNYYERLSDDYNSDEDESECDSDEIMKG